MKEGSHRSGLGRQRTGSRSLADTLTPWGSRLISPSGAGDRTTMVSLGTAPWELPLPRRGLELIRTGPLFLQDRRHTVALKSNGTLWAWGLNIDGQFGDGTNEMKYSPVQIGSATDWTSISTGCRHTVAFKSNGSLWAWGYNGSAPGGKQLRRRITPLRFKSERIRTGPRWQLETLILSPLKTTALCGDGDRGTGVRWETGRETTGMYRVESAWRMTGSLLGPERFQPCPQVRRISVGMGRQSIRGTGRRNLGIRTLPTRIGTDTDWMVLDPGNGYVLALKSN